MRTLIYSLARGGFILLAVGLGTSHGVAQDTPMEKGKQLPAAILRKYDADKDGALSDSEKAAWKADVQRGRAEAQAKRLEKFDVNRDGKLDKAEKAEATKASAPSSKKPAETPVP
jgi:hypothetical protein